MPKTDNRLRSIRDMQRAGDCVVYVMSRDQRVQDNHALLAAQAAAVERGIPLVVTFNLHLGSGVRGQEHYLFMLQGLEEVAMQLEDLKIPFIMTAGKPADTIINTLGQLNPAEIFYDFNPLPAVRQLQQCIAESYAASHTVVDTHNIVPAWHASSKQEFAAHTFRHKIHRLLEQQLIEPPLIAQQQLGFTPPVKSMTFHEAHTLVATLPSRGITLSMPAGEKAAHAQLNDFITTRLAQYASDRNNIALDAQTGLSPYLHFGQISSLRVALNVITAVSHRPQLFDEARMPAASEPATVRDGMNALFEEMIVRKELADNFCLYAASCNSLTAAPAWAQTSLNMHRDDPRDFLYTREQWEQAATHDAAWNAAQRQLLRTGKMHGYMRMYWAKKILEWSATPEQALADAIYLNDAYSIDGGDPNGYTGILWSIAGLHDRPWSERPVFGKIRYMNSAGLQRKFDLASYISQWS